MSFRGSSISEELWGVIETSGNLLAVGPAAARTRPPQRRLLPAPPRQFSRVATPRECLHASPATVQRGGPAHCGAWLVVAARGRSRCSRRGRCRRQSRPRGCATASTRGLTRIHWRAWWRWWRWRRGATAGRACIWKACMEYVQKKKTGAPRPPRWPGCTPRVEERHSPYAGDDLRRPRRGPHRFNRTRAVRRRPATSASTVKSRPQMTCAVDQLCSRSPSLP